MWISRIWNTLGDRSGRREFQKLLAIFLKKPVGSFVFNLIFLTRLCYLINNSTHTILLLPSLFPTIYITVKCYTSSGHISEADGLQQPFGDGPIFTLDYCTSRPAWTSRIGMGEEGKDYFNSRKKNTTSDCLSNVMRSNVRDLTLIYS